MTTFLIAFAAFCIGHYLGRKDGIEDGSAEAKDDINEYCQNSGCHLNA